MRIEHTIASLLCVSLLTGCLASTHTIPITEAPRLETGVVAEIDGDQEKIGSRYTVKVVPNAGQVLLREDEAGGAIKAYPASKTGGAPPASLKPLPRLGGPVSGSFVAGDLVLKGPLDTFVIPHGSAKELQILTPSPGKTAGLWIGVGLGSVVVAFGVVLAVAIANANPESLIDLDCSPGCFASWRPDPFGPPRPIR